MRVDRKFIIFLITFFVACIVFIPIVYSLRTHEYRLDSDYDMLYPIFSFVNYAYQGTWDAFIHNPYIGLGIHQAGDPGTLIFHPVIVPLVLLLGPRDAIVATQFGSMFLSGITMWMFLKSLRIRSIPLLWGTVSYQLSGYLFASYASGHLLKSMSYALIPLLLISLFKQLLTKKELFFTGLVLTVITLGADFYTPLFYMLLFVVSRIYFAVRKKLVIKEVLYQTGSIVMWMIMLNSFRLIPYILYVLPQMIRFYSFNAFSGSVHPFLFWLPLALPFKLLLYDRPFFQRTIGFYYNWYEYYAFITPIPFIILLKFRSIKFNETLRMGILLIVACILYVGMKYPFSPFFWLYTLFPFLQTLFRVPQRMNVFLVSLIIGCTGMVLMEIYASLKNTTRKRAIHALLIVSLIWLYIDGQSVMKLVLVPKSTEKQNIVTELKIRDPSSYRVTNFVCCIQTYLIEEKIPVVNLYYAWRPGNVPSFLNASESGWSFEPLNTVRTKYVISDNSARLEKFGYQPFITSQSTIVWITDNPTVL